MSPIMRSELDFLAYDESLISGCESVLKKHWHKSRFKLSRKPKDSQRLGTFYCLIDTQVPGVITEERVNTALPLPVVPIEPFSTPGSFYFGVRLRFDHQYESRYALTSLSVSLFAGRQLEPIVRAEWDRRDIGSSRHAQPHWHLLGLSLFAKQNLGGFSPKGGGQSEAVNFSANSLEPRTEIERIHFPSSAAWHTGASTTIQHPFVKNEQVFNWLGGLAEYMVDQLGLVVAKSGVAVSPSAPAAVDFTPGG
ncbi:TPA: hypothetical protein SHT56_002290 [Pseudomonas aeruginosa]|nr:hypothetical protein [Pseudomonas aeruginosa]